MFESVDKSPASPTKASDVWIYCAVAVVAALMGLFPGATFSGLAGGAALILTATVLKRATSLSLWHVLVLIALAPFMILNYGFANIAFHVGGVPVIVGHTLMFAALGLALFKSRGQLLGVLREPSALCLLALFPLAVLHLMVDVPRYGLYALRDASMFLETIFILLGLYWATHEKDVRPLLKWLFVIFVLNLAYGMTYPWGETIQSLSPVSGIFLKVPIFGNYWGTAVIYLAGALFVICLGSYIVKWPRWILFLLATAQVFGLAIQQHRAMYLGLGLCLVVFLVTGEFRKFAKLASILGIGLVAVLLLSSLNVRIEGRIGPVNGQFLEEHFLSLLGGQNTPAVGSIYERENWYEQTKKRIESHSTSALLVGEGFGFPLINFVDPEGVAVRQPHNSNLTVLLRLGLVGLGLWIAFNLIILSRFYRVYKIRRHMDPQSRSSFLWFFLFYMLCFIEWSVQPGLEFSAGAITFYFLIGFALGTMRRQLWEQSVDQLSSSRLPTEAHDPELTVPQLTH